MPRKSNQTQYDGMMSVFKQSPIRGESQRRQRPSANPPARVVDSSLLHPPRSHTPRVPTTPVGLASPSMAFPNEIPLASYPDSITHTSPYGWGETAAVSPLPYSDMSSLPVAGAYYTDPAYSMQPFGASPLSTSPLPLGGSNQVPKAKRWMLQMSYNGQSRRIYLSAEKFQFPQTHCKCGTLIRLMHLPTLTIVNDWQPDVNVLWNFRGNGRNDWIEGPSQGNYISQAECPVCHVHLRLYGPSS
ncbi:hypothetical protein M0805_009076 [Coniferiporia weirii]|nr:hypothetical protein M0805_009076 [Coniferiporia weirii]